MRTLLIFLLIFIFLISCKTKTKTTAPAADEKTQLKAVNRNSFVRETEIQKIP